MTAPPPLQTQSLARRETVSTCCSSSAVRFRRKDLWNSNQSFRETSPAIFSFFLKKKLYDFASTDCGTLVGPRGCCAWWPCSCSRFSKLAWISSDRHNAQGLDFGSACLSCRWVQAASRFASVLNPAIIKLCPACTWRYKILFYTLNCIIYIY